MTVYVIDDTHPNGGYIANKEDIPKGVKTMTIKQYEKYKIDSEKKQLV